jgi:chromosome segregation ATPase
MSLAERIRPSIEAAPWVCEEVKALEAELAQVKKEREAYVKACDVWIETARQVGEKLQETEARAEKAEQISDEAIKDRNRLVICLAAADAEVAKAEQERDAWKEDNLYQRNRVAQFEQENARLREALAAIRDAPGGGPAKRIAMQALGEP